MNSTEPSPEAVIPTIDIAPFLANAAQAKEQVAGAVGQACEHIGFLTITGHGVPLEQIEQTALIARVFFDLPMDEKLLLPLTPAGAGYSPLKGETLAASLGQATPADIKESLNVSHNFDLTPWPDRPAELRPVLTNYFQMMSRLAGDLMRIFALALALPQNYFADKIHRSSSFLRIINYPPPVDDPEPGQLRAGAHSDYGTLTVLRSENVAGGLQVQNRAGAWINVQVPPDAFVVNLGDMMMRWTNERWVSTLHRVVNPPAARRQASRRQSLVFFHNPNPDAVVECLPGCCGPDNPARYAPITAGEFIAEKSRKAYGAGT
jgi:isopenicillin N synthase-like dioxygenase